jgi:hypothetical protein
VIDPYRCNTRTLTASLRVRDQDPSGLIAPIRWRKVFQVNNQGIGAAFEHLAVSGCIGARSEQPCAA